jgi:hypothetical protein
LYFPYFNYLFLPFAKPTKHTVSKLTTTGHNNTVDNGKCPSGNFKEEQSERNIGAWLVTTSIINWEFFNFGVLFLQNVFYLNSDIIVSLILSPDFENKYLMNFNFLGPSSSELCSELPVF